MESGDAVVGGGRRSDLSALPLQSIEYTLICRGTETTVYSIFLIILVSLTQPLRAVIECVAEWLVYTCEDIAAGHEDLENKYVRGIAGKKVDFWPTRSNAVEHARGWVATKMGFEVIFKDSCQ